MGARAPASDLIGLPLKVMSTVCKNDMLHEASFGRGIIL